MKKLALYLVLLLGLGIYAACDGGGDDNDDKCGERLENLETFNIGETKEVDDKSPFIKYFVFTTESAVTDYTLQFHTKTNVFQWFLYEYDSTCYDDYTAEPHASDYRNTDDPETIEFDNVDKNRLKASTKYFLRIKASTNDNDIKFKVSLTK